MHTSHTTEESIDNQSSSENRSNDHEANYFTPPEKDDSVNGWMIAFFALLGYMALKMLSGKQKV